MKKNKKAVIFDLDGVIVDSESIESRSLELLIRSYGKKPVFNSSGLIHEAGVSGGTYERIKKKHNIKEGREVLKTKKRAIFKKLIKSKKLKPLPGFLDLIDNIKQKNLKVGLASSRFPEYILLILDNLDARDYFEAIVGLTETIKHKPAPDTYLECANKLNVHPKFCVVLEDSQTGVEAAKNAGMKVIGIPSIYTREQDFSKTDKIVSSLSDINIQMIHEL
ncbi:hypothetical protein A2164_01455 [Candidatus Curtissbacteria bacterium RBG_13_35_7]|uniref:FCP1 homology domain-containing protein n=1 Tax=Candidatus Curtissbacteria bacterium RBG_13_35_7 TaxID=1797705 RepID=A0A1F5G1J2_9BACT|nr:MAG: hypothetical protein A2164_01455 [Candidatus Curtissbacteria bacterium RBG_13_35_7]